MATVYVVSCQIGRGQHRHEFFLNRLFADHCARVTGSVVEVEQHDECPECGGSGEMGGFNAGLTCALCNGDGTLEG